MLIQEEIDENCTVYIDAAPAKDELAYKVDRSGGLVNAETGQKSDILIQVPSAAGRGDAAQVVKKMRIMEDDEDGMDEEYRGPGVPRSVPSCSGAPGSGGAPGCLPNKCVDKSCCEGTM